MIPLKMLQFMGKSLAETSMRRLRREQNPAQWSFRFEVLVNALRASNAHNAQLPLEQARALQDEAGDAFKIGVVRQQDSMAGVDVEWFHPIHPPKDGCMLYLHGGAYVTGSTRSHAALIAHLARAAGMPALGINYRRAPEHSLQAAIDDFVCVYKEMVEVQGYDPQKLCLSGDSAGGHIILNGLILARQQNLPMPASAALISPWIDVACRADSYRRNEPTDWTTAEDLRALGAMAIHDLDPDRAPCYLLDADFSGLPPLLIHVGGAEMLLDEIIAAAGRLAEQKVPVDLHVFPGMVHDFQLLADVYPTAREAVTELGAFLHQSLTEPEALINFLPDPAEIIAQAEQHQRRLGTLSEDRDDTLRAPVSHTDEAPDQVELPSFGAQEQE